jgi:hypothetical protein
MVPTKPSCLTQPSCKSQSWKYSRNCPTHSLPSLNHRTLSWGRLARRTNLWCSVVLYVAFTLTEYNPTKPVLTGSGDPQQTVSRTQSSETSPHATKCVSLGARKLELQKLPLSSGLSFSRLVLEYAWYSDVQQRPSGRKASQGYSGLPTVQRV